MPHLTGGEPRGDRDQLIYELTIVEHKRDVFASDGQADAADHWARRAEQILAALGGTAASNAA